MNPYQSIIDTQREHFYTKVRQKSLWERKQTLQRLKKWIKTNESYILGELAKDFKKSPEEIMFSEIKPVVGEIKDAIRNLRFWAEDDRKSTPLFLLGTKARVIKEPKGNCLIIAPWNFPFMLAIGPLVSAIAAGNCVVVKPSENTPHCEQLITQLITEVFDPGEVVCVTGGVNETTHLLALKWDHIFFTGSPQVGKVIMQAAAKHLTSVTLELGGKNPVIVDETASLKDAAKKIIWGKFFNCGQSCIAPNYVFVHSKVHDKFVVRLQEEYEKSFGANGEAQQKAFYPRIVNSNHFLRVKALIKNAIDTGGMVISGNEFSATENYIAPTILDNISPENPIFQEEIFGPVLPLLKYSDINVALATINNEEKPLALYVFSKSKKNIRKIVQNTSAGTTGINDTTIQFIHPNLPFGGVNHSGIGKAHGKYGFNEFTNERSILKQRRGWTTAKLIYPPYTQFKRFVIKAITWWV